MIHRMVPIVILGAVVALAVPGFGYDYDPADFATEVVEYVQGTGIPSDWLSGIMFNRSQSALGRPTVDTTGDGLNTGSSSKSVPVVSVNPPLRYWELVSIGEEGRLILKLGRPVVDDPRNPCGIDFIIYGNTFQLIDGTVPWQNGNPHQTVLGLATTSDEPGVVSVSKTGPPEPFDWQTFSNGPYADNFAPTLGRVFDPAHPDPSLGPDNDWWGEPTDPRIPLKRSLTSEHTAGLTVAECARLYGHSAGGTGFDLADVGLDEALYVKIENSKDSGLSPEIDAIAVVRHEAAPPDPDLDCDLDVDHDDLVLFENCVTGPAIGPPSSSCIRVDFDKDGDVDQVDFGLFQRCMQGPGKIVYPGCWE